MTEPAQLPSLPNSTPTPSPSVPVAPKNEDRLVALVRSAIPDLTDTEEQLVRHVARGALFNRQTGDKEKDDPAKANDWGDDRAIRAAVLSFLCTDRQAKGLISHRGIETVGLRIDGPLDLDEVTVPFRVGLLEGACTDPLSLINLRIKVLNLDGTQVPGITGDGLRVDGDFFLRDGFVSNGEVRLLGATIGGSLSCIGGRFEDQSGGALKADRMKVEGNLALCSSDQHRFEAVGEVRLNGANIGGNLECDGARFENKGGYALNADGMKVAGGVFLRSSKQHRFEAVGAVRLPGATIGGDLTCVGARFEKQGGDALNVDRMTVVGSMFLCSSDRHRFEAVGAVRLLGATIGVNLECHGARFENQDGYALNADGMNVTGAAYFRPGQGHACAINGKISLVCSVIGSGLQWRGPTLAKDAELDLDLARVGTLYDDADAWPEAGNLRLDRFHYDHIDHRAPTDANGRLEWLRRQHKDPTQPFNPQPYEQLAGVLKSMGHDYDARQILIHKERDRAEHNRNRTKVLARFWTWLLDVTIAYGYEPWRALIGAAFVVLVSAAAFTYGERNSLIRCTNQDGIKAETPDTITTDEKYPAFNPLFYSLDEFLPIINLRMGDYYVPDAKRGATLFDRTVLHKQLTVTTGTVLRWWLWAHILAGWLLTTLFVAGVTGIIRK